MIKTLHNQITLMPPSIKCCSHILVWSSGKRFCVCLSEHNLTPVTNSICVVPNVINWTWQFSPFMYESHLVWHTPPSPGAPALPHMLHNASVHPAGRPSESCWNCMISETRCGSFRCPKRRWRSASPFHLYLVLKSAVCPSDPLLLELTESYANYL